MLTARSLVRSVTGRCGPARSNCCWRWRREGLRVCCGVLVARTMPDVLPRVITFSRISWPSTVKANEAQAVGMHQGISTSPTVRPCLLMTRQSIFRSARRSSLLLSSSVTTSPTVCCLTCSTASISVSWRVGLDARRISSGGRRSVDGTVHDVGRGAGDPVRRAVVELG